jgi:predicted RNA-binding Zn-ribbon protein involved in translation (DUF1610 family)
MGDDVVKVESLCGIADLTAAIFDLDVDEVRMRLGAPPKHRTMICVCGKSFDPHHGYAGYREKGSPQKILYCSLECAEESRVVTFECAECGNLFPRSQSIVLHEAKYHSEKKLHFCNRKCFGAYSGKHYGWAVYPSSGGGAKRKYDWNLVWEKHLETGYGSLRLSRVLKIPDSTITNILSKMRATGKVDVPTVPFSRTGRIKKNEAE